jgi:hypothetical protein
MRDRGPINNGHARWCQEQEATPHGHVMQKNLSSSRCRLGEAIETDVLDATQALPSIVHPNFEHSRIVLRGSILVSCASVLVRKRHVQYAFEHDEHRAYNHRMMEGGDVRRQRVGRHFSACGAALRMTAEPEGRRRRRARALSVQKSYSRDHSRSPALRFHLK